jgi:hypothetical protein
MSIYTKCYADNKQRDPKWRARQRIAHNPKANFVYPRASIKARERSEFRHPAVRTKLVQAMELAMGIKRGG